MVVKICASNLKSQDEENYWKHHLDKQTSLEYESASACNLAEYCAKLCESVPESQAKQSENCRKWISAQIAWSLLKGLISEKSWRAVLYEVLTIMFVHFSTKLHGKNNGTWRCHRKWRHHHWISTLGPGRVQHALTQVATRKLSCSRVDATNSLTFEQIRILYNFYIFSTVADVFFLKISLKMGLDGDLCFFLSTSMYQVAAALKQI